MTKDCLSVDSYSQSFNDEHWTLSTTCKMERQIKYDENGTYKVEIQIRTNEKQLSWAEILVAIGLLLE